MRLQIVNKDQDSFMKLFLHENIIWSGAIRRLEDRSRDLVDRKKSHLAPAETAMI